MQRWVAIAAALVAACGTAFGLVDPHDETNPERCRSCHTSGIHAQDRRQGDSHLLQESIDGVCLICHRPQDCCEEGQKHADQPISGALGMGHPSDIDVGRVRSRVRPRTLPVFAGRISCATCHLHDRQKPKDWKLLRLAKVRPTGVDWTALCADCHEGY